MRYQHVITNITPQQLTPHSSHVHSLFFRPSKTAAHVTKRKHTVLETMNVKALGVLERLIRKYMK